MATLRPDLSLGPECTVGFPFVGDWVAVNTPAERIPSHGTDFFGQRFAFDFARITPTRSGFSRHSLWRQFLYYIPAEDFLAWNEPVYTVFSGAVLAAEDGWPDRLRINSTWEVFRSTLLQRKPNRNDIRSLTGNYVLVEGEPGVALFAHLRQGSIRVLKGERVQEGQQLANVGNSGNSTMPHLHFHVMDQADPWHAKGVYCGFRAAGDGATPFVPQLMEPFRALRATRGLRTIST